MPSVADIDLAIMAEARPQWLKVARIVAIIGQRHDGVDYQSIAERVAHLAKVGRLDAQGDVADWRHSEVRLPAAKL